MKHKKMIVVVLALCVISAGVFMVYKNHQDKLAREREANFYISAIDAFWDNEELFEQVKDHFLALPNSIYSFNFYYNNDRNCFIETYNDYEIGSDLERSLLDLHAKLEPARMNIFFGPYNEQLIEKKIVFLLNMGISRKGIIYLVNENSSNEEELKNRFSGYAVLYHLEGNWYYYEELPGV